jgi:hypothetical protein
MTEGTQREREPGKKRLSPVAWIAIGCGGVTLIGVIIAIVLSFFVFQAAKEVTGDFGENPSKVAAELFVRMNPELDLVESDDEAGTITFRNNKTGEEVTMDFEDVSEGKFTVTTDEGEFSVDATDSAEEGVVFQGPSGETRFGGSASVEDVPSWVPLYPGATGAQGTFSSKTPQGLTGVVSLKTSDDTRKVMDHYQELFEEQGYEIKATSSTTTPEGTISSIAGELASQGRSVNVAAIGGENETQITINYNSKAE